MHKITFHFTSPLAITEMPVFDGILSYCQYCEKYKGEYDFHTPHGTEVCGEIDIPLEESKHGFFLASKMFLGQHYVEGTDSWKKKWNVKHDAMVDFGKKQRRVHCGSGTYKNYDIPVPFISAKIGWFFFEGDANSVAHLIGDHLVGIGKKTRIGFGWFSKFDIEKVPDSIEIFYRPLPMTFMEENIRKFDNCTIIKRFGAYRPPYWLPKNQGDVFDVEN